MISPAHTLVLWLALLALAPRAALAADTPDEQFRRAADHYRGQRWEPACEEFAKLLAAPGTFARPGDARYFYGESLVQLKRWPEAGQQFAELLQREPNSKHAAAAQFRVAEAAYMVGDDRTAQPALAGFRQRYPDHALNTFALPYLGNIALQANQLDVAADSFEESLRRFPQGPLADESRLGLAQARQRQGQLAAARTSYEQLARAGGPLAEQAWFQRGACENALGNFDAADGALSQFRSRYPQSKLTNQARLAQGYAQFKLGRSADAEQSLDGLANDPQLGVDAGYWLAQAQKANHHEQAAAATLAGLRVDTQHRLAPAIAYHKADALARAGQIEPARQAFGDLLEQHANSSWADDALVGQLRLAIDGKQPEEVVRTSQTFLAKFAESPLAAQVRLAQGQALLALDKPSDALAALAPLLNEQATNQSTGETLAQAQATAAISQGKLGQFDQAQKLLAALGAAAGASELAAEASYQVGELALAAGKTDLSQQLFSAGTGSSKNEPAANSRSLGGLAWSHLKAERWSEAADAFDKLLKSDPQGPQAAEAVLGRASALERLDQNEAAVELYHQLIDTHPTSPRVPEALARAARVHEQLNQPDEAAKCYAELIEKHGDAPQLDAALYRYAGLLKPSDANRSAELLRKLITDYPDSRYVADARLRLAEHSLQTEQLGEAENLLANVADQDPANKSQPQALLLAGRVALSKRDWKTAETQFAQLVESYPDHELSASARYLLADSQLKQNDNESAVETLKQLAASTTGRTDAWLATAELRRAQALGQLRRWSEAEEVARTIRERFPDFEKQYEVDYLIGRSLVARAEFDKARAQFAQVFDAPGAAGTETAAMARWMTGESYFHQENFAAALTEYLHVPAGQPRWHTAALLQAGKCAEALNRPREAIDHYQRLTQDFPTSELAAEATRRAQALEQRAAGTRSNLK